MFAICNGYFTLPQKFFYVPRNFHYFLSLMKIETYSGGKIGGRIDLFI